ncbi:hypothetical protein C900_00221 [Fulvivirga imtechensis AK7]|uniref:Uncharacterized protein n=1 Tax=Fulvivirga imtechensis AK7 TaxID=1237149 RepID=L8JI94_9BACT|nr:hypothetical protein [Fulvivirga imtechensis]ELR68596.1 hypothetical protein C900_00221 [Fulvivirga imtechensis AK7]
MRKVTVIIFSLVYLIACEGKKEQEVIKINDISEIDTTNTAIIVDEDGNILYQNPEFGFNGENIFIANSINDTVFYSIGEDSLGTNKKNRVFKYEYHRESFQIDIKDDSIQLGDEFIGYIAFEMNKNNKVIINGEDEDITITQGDFEQDSSLSFQPYEYRIVTQDTGVKEFKGKVFVDNEEYPFEYKYVVVAADSLDRIQE